MEKPTWRRLRSSYVVDSPHMRLRADDVVLPDGTLVPNYYVRESNGYATILALTPDERVIMVRQYRYGSDAIHLELPAGTVGDGEDPDACILRELAEETGFEVLRYQRVAEYYAEPVRSQARARVYVGWEARKTREPQLDATECLEVETVTIPELRAMLEDGRIDAGHCIAAGYLALDFLRRLRAAAGG
jgi:ADP-ribose pyrophosphatase